MKDEYEFFEVEDISDLEAEDLGAFEEDALTKEDAEDAKE